MHWLRLMMEVWVVFGVVSVVAGLMWTARLSRETDTEISNARPCRNGSWQLRPHTSLILPNSPSATKFRNEVEV